jgi:hypothetical protein
MAESSPLQPANNSCSPQGYSRIQDMLNPRIFVNFHICLGVPTPVPINRGIAEGELMPLKITEHSSQVVPSLFCLESSQDGSFCKS